MACRTHQSDGKCVQNFGFKALSAFTRPAHTCDSNIKMDLRKIKWECVDWIHLAQDVNLWQTCLLTPN